MLTSQHIILMPMPGGNVHQASPGIRCHEVGHMNLTLTLHQGMMISLLFQILALPLPDHLQLLTRSFGDCL